MAFGPSSPRRRGHRTHPRRDRRLRGMAASHRHRPEVTRRSGAVDGVVGAVGFESRVDVRPDALVGSVLSGLSQSMGQLIAFRAKTFWHFLARMRLPPECFEPEPSPCMIGVGLQCAAGNVRTRPMSSMFQYDRQLLGGTRQAAVDEFGAVHDAAVASGTPARSGRPCTTGCGSRASPPPAETRASSA